MITIHHLGISQSDRVVWLMEELGLPYRLKWYHRRADNRMAPAEYLALHPAATSPVISDDGRNIAESVVILEYICHRYGGGRFTVKPDQPNYTDYLYWMQFNNNTLGLLLTRMALAAATGPQADVIASLVRRREEGYYGFMEQQLGKTPYLAGSEFTCADVMCMFNLVTGPLFGGRKFDDLPNVKAYAERIMARPAYIKAMGIAGPGAKAPTV